ncbi:type II secretion system minor pseudopilin GspH [Leucothrix mucor]|uniref:type II secretion system minor pseudopilin GspH n=1 Tax=Leucothrix mucor TaxID=45248 RepID=UPI0003B3BFAE|nr:type II secretion system minor pseudopilin GspH [Leucothrix mucor]
MHQSARPKAAAAGYTLIEVMVVIAIMALLTSIVIPYLPVDKTKQLLATADRFKLQISYAQSQSILQSQDMGLMLTEDGYQFVQRTPEAWQPVDDEGIPPTKLDDFLAQQLFIEDVEYLSEEPLDDESVAPAVLFFSSGETTPFEYRLSLSEEAYVRLKFDALGDVEEFINE